MFISVRAGKINLSGAIVGGVLAYLVFLGAGYTGIAMLAAFFIFGSAATSVNVRLKEKLKVAEENRGRRNAGQAIANAGVAGILGAPPPRWYGSFRCSLRPLSFSWSWFLQSSARLPNLSGIFRLPFPP